MAGKQPLAGVYRLGRGLIRSLFQPAAFDIKRGYLHRDTVEPHDDRGMKDEYQKEVYQQAASLMQQHGLRSVIDVGCGSGYKLMKYLGEYVVVGIDEATVTAENKKQYPNGTWISLDAYQPEQLQTDLILCADVIEHVPDPDAFMKSLLQIQGWTFLIISTPERDLKRGWYHYGPPPNPHHYREWNTKEFLRFVSKYVEVVSHEVTNREQGTQMIVGRNK